MSAPRVVPSGGLPSFEMVPGVRVDPIAGEALNVNVVVLSPGAVAPVHTHTEEQIGYVVSGTCVFSDGDGHWDLAAGDTYHAAPGVPHGATAGDEGCVIIDAFSPPKAEIVELLRGR